MCIRDRLYVEWTVFSVYACWTRLFLNFEHGKRMTPTGRARLIADEGLRLKVYDDKTGEPIDGLPSGGVPTIGIAVSYTHLDVYKRQLQIDPRIYTSRRGWRTIR